MENSKLLVAMADECKRIIMESEKAQFDLPKTLRPKHLLWMCKQIERHAEHGRETKLHRWIGFIQCGMMANQMLDLDGAKAMFDKAKNAHGETGEDLLDHLDTESSFKLELGGEG